MTKTPSGHEEVVEWYRTIRNRYEELCAEVQHILSARLQKIDLPIVSITHRAKEVDSLSEKLSRKHYDDPRTQITDFAGVRIVCNYTCDVDRVAGIVAEEFDIQEHVNKASTLGVDKMGYTGMHFVVKLPSRYAGYRYDPIVELCCEIQVRTTLQDA